MADNKVGFLVVACSCCFDVVWVENVRDGDAEKASAVETTDAAMRIDRRAAKSMMGRMPMEYAIVSFVEWYVL